MTKKAEQAYPMAKTFDYLYPQIASFKNLYAAYCKAARGKRGQPPMAVFDLNDRISRRLDIKKRLSGE